MPSLSLRKKLVSLLGSTAKNYCWVGLRFSKADLVPVSDMHINKQKTKQ